MGYRAYPEYKESGIEWFRNIPSDWTVHRLKMLASEPLKYGANEAADLEDPDLPRFIRITDVNSDGSLNPDTFRSLPEKTAEPYLLEDGDILLARSGATVGKSFIYSPEWGKAAYAGYLIRLRTIQNILHKRFAYYFFQSSPYWANIDSELIQATIQNFSAEKYSVICIPTPDLCDQGAIAHFIDHKTVQIDRLIEKKQELVEKLQEQRTAFTIQAVTKGLDSNAAMKDSGVEWLGSVPEHWDVHQLSLLTETIQTGPFGSQLHAADYVEGGVPLINPAHLVSGNIIPDEQSAVDTQTVERLNRHKLKHTDIIMARRGEIGRCALVEEEQAGWLCGTGSLIVRLAQGNSRFFSIVISSGGFSKKLELHAVGTTMLNLNPTIVGRMLVPVPPLAEQNQIVSYIDSATKKIDRSITKARETIGRLQEYRTALITAAVTGQIDVRDWQAPACVEEPEADKEVA